MRCATRCSPAISRCMARRPEMERGLYQLQYYQKDARVGAASAAGAPYRYLCFMRRQALYAASRCRSIWPVVAGLEAVDVVLASEGTLLVGEQALVPSLRRARAVRREQDARRKQHAVAMRPIFAFDPPTASL